MSELNRPETPGPWDIVDNEYDDPDAYDSPEIWGFRGGHRVWIAQTRWLDAPAIADLPAWIEAHDEWKARAEKAEATLAVIDAESREWCRSYFGNSTINDCGKWIQRTLRNADYGPAE